MNCGLDTSSLTDLSISIMGSDPYDLEKKTIYFLLIITGIVANEH